MKEKILMVIPIIKVMKIIKKIKIKLKNLF